MISRQYSSRTLIAFSVAALIVCSIPVFGARFLNDMEFYSLFADKLLSGRVLYRDAMDTKPPLVFLHYAGVFKLFGLNNVTAVKVVTMAWLGLSALVMVKLRRALAPTAAVPALVAPVFILASYCGWGEDFLSSNTELLANLFIVAGVLLLVWRDFGWHPLHLVAGGCCVGIACLYRYQSAAALAAYLATLLLRRRQIDRKVLRLLLVGVGAALPCAVLVVYYAQLGALSDLRLMLALQAHYAGDPDGFHLPTVLGRIATAVAGLWLILLLALRQTAAILRKRSDATRSEIFQLMFAAWSALTFLAGRRFFPHYFVQAIPPLVLLAVARLDSLHQGAEPAGRRKPPWLEAHAVAILVAMAAGFTVINGAYFWTRTGDSSSRNLVAFVESHSAPNDEVLLWAWRPQLLLETRRSFATRLLVNSPLIGQIEPTRRRDLPATRRKGLPDLWPAFLRDLASAPPRLLIDDPPDRSQWTLDRFPQLASLLAGYHPCQVIDDLCVFLRRD
jgi:hypothetical protein